MAHVYEVDIDVELIRGHRSEADRKEFTAQSVLESLLKSGIRWNGGSWTAHEESLGAFHKSEYRVLRRM